MEFVEDNLPLLMFLLGLVMLVTILMRRYLRYFKKLKREDRQAAKTAVSKRSVDSSQPLLDAPPEILRWQVEMHDTARELKAELDSKISILQALMIQAEHVQARLESTLQEREQQATPTEDGPAVIPSSDEKDG